MTLSLGDQRARRRFRLAPLWLATPAILFLAVFLIIPAGQLLIQSVLDRDDGHFTLAAYVRAFTSGVYIRTLTTTFTTALVVTAICVVLACPMAIWLVSLKSRMQRLVTVLILMAFWTSSLVKNFVWLILLGRTGPISQVSEAMGLGPLDVLFGWPVTIFALVHTMLPLAVLTMLPVMTRVDKRLTLSAQTLGASPAQALWLVFMQLSFPGIGASILLVFIGSLGFFITPALLGSPRETMIGQSIIQQINQFQNWQFAAALSAILVMATLLACLIYDRIFGLSSISGGTKTASGRADRRMRHVGQAVMLRIANAASAIAAGASRLVGGRNLGWLLPAYCWLLTAILFLPILLIAPMAFTSSTFLSLPPPGYSLRWVEAYLDSPMWIAATLRSFVIGLIVAALTTVLAGMAAYGLARGKSKAGPIIFLMFLLPMILPPIFIAVAIFYLFSTVSLVGSDAGIVLGHTIMALPITFVIITAALNNHDWRLEQAAETLGAPPLARLLRISLPLMFGGLAAGFVFAFLVSFEELTIALFIGGGIRTTLPKQMWDNILLNVEPTLAVASLVVVVVAMAMFLLAELLIGRRR